MRVLIVGTGGYVGSRLTACLETHGLEVVGLSSSRPGGIDPATGLLDPMFRMDRDFGAVIYLAQSLFSPTVPPHLLAVNVLSAVRLAQLATGSKVQRFVYASAGNVYAPSFSPRPEGAVLRRDNWYSLSKIQAEEALRLFSPPLEVCIARLFGVYGPGQTKRLVPTILNSVLSGGPITLQRNPGDKEDVSGLRISLCYIDDVVEILKALVTCGGPSVLNVAGPRPVSVRELGQALGELTGREPHFDLSEGTRDTDLIADVSLLRSTLDPPFTDLKQGLSATVEQATKPHDV